MWRCVDLALTDVSEERITSIFRVEKICERGTSVSRWLQTEPPVENTQIYKNRERGRVGHMEKSIERRGVGSVEVRQAGSRGMARTNRGSCWGGGARATERVLTP
jgi:hypothetical protein